MTYALTPWNGGKIVNTYSNRAAAYRAAHKAGLALVIVFDSVRPGDHVSKLEVQLFSIN